MEVKRMWANGPLRQFSDEPFKGSIPVTGGYAGAYVCDVYGHVTSLEGEDGGVRNHGGRWLCVPCGERHEQDKARDARRKARQAQRLDGSVDTSSFSAQNSRVLERPTGV
jgi:hypothetical protein